MNIFIEKTKTGLWRATGDEVRIHVTGKTPGEALRNAGNMLDDIDAILSERVIESKEPKE